MSERGIEWVNFAMGVALILIVVIVVARYGFTAKPREVPAVVEKK